MSLGKAAMILETLPDIEALLGREQCDDLLRLAVDHAEQSRAAIAAALAAGDGPAARAETHRLRGAVAPFGVPELADLLRRSESGETLPEGAVDAGVDAFVAACRGALAN